MGLFPHCPQSPHTHSQGERTKSVQQLQFALVQAGLMLPSRIRFHAGIFGRHTATAVSALQVLCGREPTGLYDDQARDDLCCVLASKCAMAAAGDAASETVRVVQGSLGLLIPHEALVPGEALVPKVLAALTGGAVEGGAVVGGPRLSEARDSVSMFAKDSSQRSLRLPARLTESERAVMHTVADGLALGHMSTGEGAARSLLLWKPRDWREPSSAPKRRYKAGPKTVAVIEIVDGREVSRGFVVSPAWVDAARYLASRTEPRAIAKRCKFVAATDLLDPRPLHWTVIGEPGGGGKGACIFVPLRFRV